MQLMMIAQHFVKLWRIEDVLDHGRCMLGEGENSSMMPVHQCERVGMLAGCVVGADTGPAAAQCATVRQLITGHCSETSHHRLEVEHSGDILSENFVVALVSISISLYRHDHDVMMVKVSLSSELAVVNHYFPMHGSIAQ